MKVNITPKPLAPAYPKVMSHLDSPHTIVIFTEAGKGLCIYPSDHPDYGKVSSAWVAHGWKPCCVTLDSTGE